jgi:hypothetical protein
MADSGGGTHMQRPSPSDLPKSGRRTGVAGVDRRQSCRAVCRKACRFEAALIAARKSSGLSAMISITLTQIPQGGIADVINLQIVLAKHWLF